MPAAMRVIAEGGAYFVLKVSDRWEVRKNTGLVSIEDSSYLSEDLALARLKYLAGQYEIYQNEA